MTDAAIAFLLARVRRIAVVGLSPKPHRDSNRVARYLIDRGYEVVPVYPREDRILGQPVFRSLASIPGGVDLVDVFRRSEHLPGVFDDALAAKAPAIWLQLDCIDEEGGAPGPCGRRGRGHGPLPDGRPCTPSGTRLASSFGRPGDKLGAIATKT